MYRIDCHVHPEYSPDAEGKISEYCARAVAIGLDALCFTSHLDLCDEPVVVVGGEQIPSADRRWLDAYCREIAAARREYSSRGLKVLTGLEADYFPGCEQPLRDILSDVPLDYVMGSVHYAGHYVLTRRPSAIAYYELTAIDEMARHYYESVARAAASGLFDAIGHLDIYRRYGEPIYGPVAAMIHREYAIPALRAIADAGLGIEINTSAIRRGGNEVYPGADLLSMCRGNGIRFVTIGSDAHTVADLGSGLSAGYRALSAAGYDTVCTYEGRQPVPYAIDRSDAVETP